jgi:ABC-2 type transport system permease protein
MRKILAIIKREYKEAVYKKSFIILTLLMPVLMIGFSVLPALLMQIKSQKQTRIHVIDLSHKIYAPLQKSLSGDTLKTGEPRYVFTAIEVAPNAVEATLQAEKKLIAAKKIDVLLYVPADIDSSLQVKFYARNVADLDLTSRFKNEISSIISRERLIAAGIQPELVERLTRRVKLATFKITKGGKESKSGFVQEYFGTFIFIFFLYFTIIMYGAGIMRSIIQEKNSRIVETILSGSNAFQFMAGKILGQGAVSLTQYLIWILFGLGLLFAGSHYFPISKQFMQLNPMLFLYFVIFFVLGYLLFSAMYAAVGAISNSDQEAQNASFPITLSLIVPIVLFSYVVKDPNSTLAFTLSQIPFFSPIIMFARVNLANPPMWQVLLSIGILIVTIVIVIWIVAKIFRIGILMYGKRPTLPELLKWIKY